MRLPREEFPSSLNAALAKQLQADELEFRADMPQRLKPLLEGKRLLLWEQTLQDYEYPAVELIQHIKNGFKLSGWLPEIGVFPTKAKGPSLSLEAYRSSFDSLNDKVAQQCSYRQDSDLEAGAWGREHDWQTHVSKQPL